jgi:prolyl-tRNA synthetase
MGCYGIGVSRIVAAAIEQSYDENGIIFPMSMAPVSVAVLPMQAKGEVLEAAEKLHDELWAAGVDAVIDDRDVRPGFKFKDNDLSGIPLRVVVGKKGLANGQVEFKRRSGGDIEMLDLDTAVSTISQMVKKEGGQVA